MCRLSSSKFIKLLGLIVGIVLLNIVVLSPGLLGIDIGSGEPLEAALGVALLVGSFLILIYGVYTLLLKPPVSTPVRSIKTHEDYIEALRYYRGVKVLKKDVMLAIDQLERLEKKKAALLDTLSQRFSEGELSYKKFRSVIEQVEALFYLNIRGVLNKLHVFDATEFESIEEGQRAAAISSRLIQQKRELYEEYLRYVTGYLSANEEILLKLDKLLLEISLLDSVDYDAIEEMSCMKEIDELIRQTKYYKQ